MPLFGKEAGKDRDARRMEQAEQETQERLKAYEPFAKFGTVNCRPFAEANWEVWFDDMQFAAELKPRHFKMPDDYSPNQVWMDVRVLPLDGKAVFTPRLLVENEGTSLPVKVFLRCGDDRYQAGAVGQRSYRKGIVTEYSTCVVPLGPGDTEILRKFARTGKEIWIRAGDRMEDGIRLYREDLDKILAFLDRCESTGVLAQETYQRQGNSFTVITSAL